MCFYSVIKTNAVAGGEKTVSPAYTDEDKVSHFIIVEGIVSSTLQTSHPFIFQDKDEAEQGGDSTLQEFYCQTERKNSRASEGSEEEEDEGEGQGIPLSISKRNSVQKTVSFNVHSNANFLYVHGLLHHQWAVLHKLPKDSFSD